jgi:hypothetical protein
VVSSTIKRMVSLFRFLLGLMGEFMF